MGWRLVLMPKRTLLSEKLVLVDLVMAMFSMESRSCWLAALSRASSRFMSVSSGLYFGLVCSWVME